MRNAGRIVILVFISLCLLAGVGSAMHPAHKEAAHHAVTTTTLKPVSTTAAPTPKRITTTTAPKQKLSTQEQAYVAVLRHNDPQTILASDAELIHLGHLVCQDLDAGNTVSQEMQSLKLNGGTQDLSIKLVGLAVTVFCPEHYTD